MTAAPIPQPARVQPLCLLLRAPSRVSDCTRPRRHAKTIDYGWHSNALLATPTTVSSSSLSSRSFVRRNSNGVGGMSRPSLESCGSPTMWNHSVPQPEPEPQRTVDSAYDDVAVPRDDSALAVDQPPRAEPKPQRSDDRKAQCDSRADDQPRRRVSSKRGPGRGAGQAPPAQARPRRELEDAEAPPEH